MAAPRILIVDDQRDISRMLRAALETLGRGYVIVDVPSAEEGQLEMRRGLVDLVITDLRLPGISGLELLRRLHKASSAAAMIVISAYADETAQSEFASLGAKFFAKPLDLAAFLKGVQTALDGREPAASAAAQTVPDDEASLRRALPERLSRLTQDLGARAALLLDIAATAAAPATASPLAQAGRVSIPSRELASLLPMVMQAVEASLKVSQALGAAANQPAAPANVHFFDGNAHDLFAANVGAAHALLIIFDGERGAGQVGQVVRYARQAAGDLAGTLDRLAALAAPPATLAGAEPARPEPAHRKKTGPLRKKTGPLAAPVPPPAVAQPQPAPLSTEALQALDAAEKKTTSQAASDFWEGVDGAGLGDERAGTLTWEQASKLGLVKGEKPDKKQ